MMPETAKAIQRLKAFEPEDEPYFLCYSGGKDSDCIRILAELAGVKYEIHHNLTTVDAPETMRYVKSIPGVIIDKAQYRDGTVKTMWNLIPRKKFPPTRLMRYCCQELKEWSGKGRMKITGVRMAESRSRKENGGVIKMLGKEKTVLKKAETELDENSYKSSPKGGLILNFDNDKERRFVEQCFRTTSTMLNPIIDWEDSDVWNFLHYYGCESNPLYQCGKARIGCVGCPMASNVTRRKELATYPGFKKAYIRSFDKMLLEREKAGLDNRCNWKTGIDVFNWWVGIDADQLSFFDEEEE